MSDDKSTARPTDKQPAPTPERADLPAVWDLVITDATNCTFHMEGREGPIGLDDLYGLIVTMLPHAARMLETDLLADMRERDATGRQRYGTPLQPHNGREALKDAYQELLDAAVYLRQAQYERDGR